jgi:hypothetical protein
VPDADAAAIAGWVNVNARGIEGKEIRPAIVSALVPLLFKLYGKKNKKANLKKADQTSKKWWH